MDKKIGDLAREYFENPIIISTELDLLERLKEAITEYKPLFKQETRIEPRNIKYIEYGAGKHTYLYYPEKYVNFFMNIRDRLCDWLGEGVTRDIPKNTLRFISDNPTREGTDVVIGVQTFIRNHYKLLSYPDTIIAPFGTDLAIPHIGYPTSWDFKKHREELCVWLESEHFIVDRNTDDDMIWITFPNADIEKRRRMNYL